MKGPDTEKVERMFNNISPDYDKLNHLLSLDIDKIWRKRALKKILDEKRPQKILDIACGTGDFTIAIAKHAPQGSHITGVDISEGMIAVMKDKVSAAGLDDKIDIVRCNGERLDFPSNSFDRVTIAFGIRNFENREKALLESLRVLKAGGRLVILELSIPSNKLIRSVYELYFLKILPLIGGKISGDTHAYRYLPASVESFPGKKQWMETMSECRFAHIGHKAFSLGICRMYTGEKL